MNLIQLTETAPVTGDSRNIVLWVIIAIVAVILIIVTSVLAKKKK